MVVFDQKGQKTLPFLSWHGPCVLQCTNSLIAGLEQKLGPSDKLLI